MRGRALTAVLPLRVSARRRTSDLDRFERLLLPSFRRFWRNPDELDFLVLVPPADVRGVDARIGSGSGFALRVLSEDVVCPSLSGRLGWHKQQILKLAAARIVSTPWYLTLDADVMLRRALSADELIRDGKAVFHSERAVYHWEWWMASGAILRSPVALEPETRAMGVTPEVLHRDTVLELLAEIARRNGTPEAEGFLLAHKDAGWSEYTLYWLFVLERQLRDRLYRGDGPMYQMAWRPEHVAPMAGGRSDDASGGAPFFVLQSTLETPVEEAERLLSDASADAAALPRRAASLLTAVLPLRAAARDKTSDLDRAERLLLPSFERYWEGSEPLEFLVLVPPGDVERVRERIAPRGAFRVRVLSEDVVCPTLSGCFGWHKQQVLKLAAARLVATPWYLTLDADVVLRRVTSPDELVREGKAVFHPKPAARHWEWWMASRTILRSDAPLSPDREMMDVTPEILHRGTTLELLAEIARRNGVADAEPFLYSQRGTGWTEYSLYWLYVLERQLQDSLYRRDGPLYEMAWQPEQVTSLARRRPGASSPEPPFFVLQSTLEIPVEEAERIINGAAASAPVGARGPSPSRVGSLFRRLLRPRKPWCR